MDDDPLEGLREAVGDAFEGTDSDELKEHARRAISEEIEAETGVRRTNRALWLRTPTRSPFGH